MKGSRGVSATLLALLAGCYDYEIPSSLPANITEEVPDAVQVEALRFPPLTGPGRIFRFGSPIGDHLSYLYTPRSRYVLYDDGSFALQISLMTPGEYRGTYIETSGGQITFRWEAWSALGAWGAEGTLVGDSLSVRYNTVMLWNDFQDALYVLEGRGAP